MSNNTESATSLMEIQDATAVQTNSFDRSRVDVIFLACAFFIPQPKGEDKPLCISHPCHSWYGFLVFVREPSE